MDVGLAFRRLTVDDLRMVRGWLNEPRVNRWYRGKPWSPEDVEEKYRPRIEGDQPTKVYVVSIGGAEIGLIQSYWIRDYPEYDRAIRGEPGWMGVDFLIGDPRFRGRGIGSRMIREFVETRVFGEEGARACVSGPALGNEASIRSLERAGFVRLREANKEIILIRERDDA